MEYHMRTQPAGGRRTATARRTAAISSDVEYPTLERTATLSDRVTDSVDVQLWRDAPQGAADRTGIVQAGLLRGTAQRRSEPGHMTVEIGRREQHQQPRIGMGEHARGGPVAGRPHLGRALVEMHERASPSFTFDTSGPGMPSVSVPTPARLTKVHVVDPSPPFVPVLGARLALPRARR